MRLRPVVLRASLILFLATACGRPAEDVFWESGLVRALTHPADLRLINSPLTESCEKSDSVDVVDVLELKSIDSSSAAAPLRFPALGHGELVIDTEQDRAFRDFAFVSANPDWHVTVEAGSFRLHKAHWPDWKPTAGRGAPLWWREAELLAEATVRRSAFYDVVLTAMGIRVYESAPRIALLVDGRSIGEFVIPVAGSRFEGSVSATAYVEEGNHTLGVRLVNKTMDVDAKVETGVFVRKLELVPKDMVVVPKSVAPEGSKLTAHYGTRSPNTERWQGFSKEHNLSATADKLLVSGEGGLDVQGESRPAIFAPPGTVFEWTVRLPRQPSLFVGMATDPGSWLHPATPVRFSLDVVPHGRWKRERRLMDETFNSWADPANGRWRDVSLDLGGWAGQQVTLRFSTASAEADVVREGCSFWSEPQLRGEADVTDRQNLVIHLIDAVRKDHLGCYGYHKQTSPTIDELAEKGVLFENPVSQFPSTCGSTASLLTGLYPVSHGCYVGGALIHPQARQLAQSLADAGYATYAICDNYLIRAKDGYSRGFDRFCSIGARYGSGLPGQTPARLIKEAVEECLRDADGRPFFLFVHSVYPHDWYWAPREFREMFATNPDGSADGPSLWTWRAFDGRARGPTAVELKEMLAFYDAEIRYADSLTGDILDALATAGARDRTLLVLTADHGEEFLDHGGWEHGRTLFKEVLEVPLIMQGATVPSRGRVRQVVRLIDVVPTVLDILGLPPMRCHGESLLPLIRGEEDAWRVAISEGGLPARSAISIREKRYKYVRTENVSEIYMKKGEFLFDLNEDPLEQKNLLAKEPDVVARMKAEANRYLARYSDWLAERKAQSLSDISPDALDDLKALGYVR